MSFVYDYVIAGGGCAGLSLAYWMMQQPALQSKRIALIEKQAKDQNDRTWCFWEMQEGAFDALVYRRWDVVWFMGEDFEQKLNLAPYVYKMLRGIDFYHYMDFFLQNYPNVERMNEEISDFEVLPNEGVRVCTHSGRVYEAPWVFSSILPKEHNHAQEHLRQQGYHPLLQHFKGWFVRSPAPCFDPQSAILMDFRVAQVPHQARFGYVLPFDAHTALVEYTVFSDTVLSQDAYDTALRTYLAEQLNLSTFDIEHEEFGVIPMTDAPFYHHRQQRLVYIGTPAGMAKPSTGYTFARIQRHTKALALALAEHKAPHQLGATPWKARFQLYDSVLLKVVDENRLSAKRVFTELFRNNKTSLVLRFLDEDTSFIQELKIMSSVPIVTFAQATAKTLLLQTHRIFKV